MSAARSVFGARYGIELMRNLLDERRDRDQLECVWPLAHDHYLFADSTPPRPAPPPKPRAGARRMASSGQPSKLLDS